MIAASAAEELVSIMPYGIVLMFMPRLVSAALNSSISWTSGLTWPCASRAWNLIALKNAFACCVGVVKSKISDRKPVAAIDGLKPASDSVMSAAVVSLSVMPYCAAMPPT